MKHINNIEHLTAEYLDLCLRSLGYTFDIKTVNAIVNAVELINEKENQTNIEDIIELKQYLKQL